MVALVDWFDPKNKRHMAAFRFYCDNGFWPNFVIPANTTVPLGGTWVVEILDKIMETK